MKRFLLILVLLAATPCFAQPSIVTLSGTLNHKSTLTISGSGFATKSPATPLKWDDFESGANGSVLTGWNLYSSGGNSGRPSYSSTITRTNSNLSARADFTNSNYNSSFGIVDYASPDLSSIYVDGWVYDDSASPDSRNVKLIRWYSDWDTTANQDRFLNIYCSSVNNSMHVSGGAGSYDYWTNGYGYLYFEKNWRHIQIFMSHGTPGNSDGTLKMWLGGIPIVNATNINLRSSSQSPWNTVWLGNYLGHGAESPCSASGDANIYWDDVYIDKTQARVEIGDAPTWASCTHREIQIPSSWSANSITLSVNQGSFSSLSSTYLYVVDPNGSVNQNGFPLGANGPLVPTNLRVR